MSLLVCSGFIFLAQRQSDGTAGMNCPERSEKEGFVAVAILLGSLILFIDTWRCEETGMMNAK
jgi:hypothetical protein